MTREEMVQAITENTQRSKSNSHRIDELACSVEALNKMALALEVLATKQTAMSDIIDKIDSKVTAIEKSPIKTVRALIGYIVAALCSVGAGAFLGFYF
ncbi:MAG: hypothetical protein E7592_05185 [Ruminococcaceae bacterium]|nr:hypothetical protein [Oscillospiraceae bacterium]